MSRHRATSKGEVPFKPEEELERDAEEQASEADVLKRQADRAELEQIKAVHQDLKNGTGSNAQRLNRVERVLARILKDMYR